MSVAHFTSTVAAAPSRKPVTSTRTFTVREFSPAERPALWDKLYDLYRATCTGLSRAQFEAFFISDEDTRLALFYGEDGTLAGCSLASLTRIVHQEKEHAVFAAGVFFRLDYRGGSAGARFGLIEALKFKLRNPLTPLAYLTRANSPATYCLLAGTMPRAYPSAARATPPDVVGVVQKLNAYRHTETIDGNPWLVKATATPRDPARLRASALNDNPLARFYQEKNPKYAAGTSLQVLIPLDLANIMGALVRLAHRSLGPRHEP